MVKKGGEILLSDILANGSLRQNIEKKITSTRKAQEVALSKARAGARLRGNPFTTLEDKGMSSVDVFCAEYELIVEKRSVLPSRERAYIESVVNQALVETLREKQKVEGMRQKKNI